MGIRERGTLRVYLGAAPGAGKTFAMLAGGRRLAADRGDVVVGYVERHGRPATREQLAGLERISPRALEYRGARFEEADVDAIRARAPGTVLVDEYAHTNVPGSRNRYRWQDVEELLTYGVSVHTTLNLANIESLQNLVEQITGVRPAEKVPDTAVRHADIAFVDAPPQVLRARVARGEVYAAASVPTALDGYFSPRNLAALRDLAVLWLDDRLEGDLEDFRVRHGLTAPLAICAPVVVGVAGVARDEEVIRHAAEVARGGRAELVGVHVRVSDGLRYDPPGWLEDARRLLERVGGRLLEVDAGDVATELIRQARAFGAARLVVGDGRPRFAARLFGRSVAEKATESAPDLEVDPVPLGP